MRGKERPQEQTKGETRDGRRGIRGSRVSGEHFLVDDDQDEQDENGDDGTSYNTLLVHPKIQMNLG